MSTHEPIPIVGPNMPLGLDNDLFNLLQPAYGLAAGGMVDAVWLLILKHSRMQTASLVRGSELIIPLDGDQDG